jgi:hypothetical protein
VNIEDIFNDYNDFKYVMISRPIDSDINGEALKHFKMFLLRSLNTASCYLNVNFKMTKEMVDNEQNAIYPTDFKHYYEKEKQNTFQIISNNEVILRCSNALKVIDIKKAYAVTSETEIKPSNIISSFTYQYIKHLDKIFVIDLIKSKLENSCNSYGSLYEKNGKLSRKVNLGFNLNNKNELSTFYNHKLKKTFVIFEMVQVSQLYKSTIYIFDENFNFEYRNLEVAVNQNKLNIFSGLKVLIINDYLYVLYYPKLHVFDLSISHVTTLETGIYYGHGHRFITTNLCSDPKNSNFIFLQLDDCIDILDINSFSFIAQFKLRHNSYFSLSMAFNSNILLFNPKGWFSIYKILFNSKDEIKINSHYTC